MLHAPLSVTRNTRDKGEKKLDISSGIGLVQLLVVWVINVVNVNDWRASNYMQGFFLRGWQGFWLLGRSRSVSGIVQGGWREYNNTV